MTASGAAALDLKFGYSTPGTAGGSYDSSKTLAMAINASGGFAGRVDIAGTGALSINGTSYTLITSLGAVNSNTGTDLQGMQGNLARNYALANNIDASATAGWNGVSGFTPVGSIGAGFTGVLEGLGHTVTGLGINRPTTDYVGLVGYKQGGYVRNLGVVGAAIKGSAYVGALVGEFDSVAGAVSNSYASGTVSGISMVGGLIGLADGLVTNSYATANVTSGGGGINIGGLLGYTSGLTNNSHASGNVTVTGGSYVGGLAGYAGNTVSRSYASGIVQGANYVGGLIGAPMAIFQTPTPRVTW